MTTSNAKSGWSRNRVRTVIVASAAALVLAACGGADNGDAEEAEAPAERGTEDTELRIRTVMDIRSLDPNVMPATTDDAIAMTIRNASVTGTPSLDLKKLRKNWSIEGLLAGDRPRAISGLRRARNSSPPLSRRG